MRTRGSSPGREALTTHLHLVPR